jgi:Ca2+-binding EF-hand superfamily protein
MWDRIWSRFKTLNEAFRFFDKNKNNSISFAEFTKSMEALKVKLSSAD